VVAAATTPLLFYGLECWEHAPAVALAAIAMWLLLEPSPARPTVAALVAGALFGGAALLRPEAGWFAVAVLASSPLLPTPVSIRTVALAIVGSLIVITPFEIHTLVHFGTVLPPHLSTNAAPLGDHWLRARAALASAWFLRSGDASIWRAAPVIAGAIVAAVSSCDRGGRRFLWSVTAIDVVLVLLTAPNDGGAQWTPRYLLFASVPLAVLAADAVTSTRRLVPLAVGALLIGGGLWNGRAAYRTLRSAKASYGRIVDFVSITTAPNGYVVSDLWWLDQVAAAINERQFLYAENTERARALTSLLSDSHADSVTVVTSRDESRATFTFGPASCLVETGRAELAVRQLVAVTYRCARRSL
jgi:hypothetical protein